MKEKGNFNLNSFNINKLNFLESTTLRRVNNLLKKFKKNNIKKNFNFKNFNQIENFNNFENKFIKINLEQWKEINTNIIANEWYIALNDGSFKLIFPIKK
jgi:hypothetical protein